MASVLWMVRVLSVVSIDGGTGVDDPSEGSLASVLSKEVCAASDGCE